MFSTYRRKGESFENGQNRKRYKKNWAEAFHHKLKRLATSSDLTLKEIYEIVCGIISDASSFNKGLAAEISEKVGVKWTPGQLFCCIHTVLGWQDGKVKKWLVSYPEGQQYGI